jgi:N-methylhydantoinase B
LTANVVFGETPNTLRIPSANGELEKLGRIWGLSLNSREFLGQSPNFPSLVLRCGDVLRVLTPGGGGGGDPLERESSKVLDEITLGLVSMTSATRDYGVVIDPDQRVVQEEKTQELRELLRRSRSPLPMIDRGERFRKVLAENRISLTSED